MLSESIAEFLREFTGSDYLTLFLLSAIPLTELRGALIIMGGMSGVNRVLGFCVAWRAPQSSFRPSFCLSARSFTG